MTCYSKMAASMYACCVRAALTWSATKALSQFPRWYARGIKRTPVTVSTPEDDLAQMKARGAKMKDPRLNPWVPYVHGDPTQEQFINVKKADVQKQRIVRPDADFTKQRKQQKFSKNPAAAAKSALKDITKSGLSFERLEDGDKRFGRVIIAAKSRREREKLGIMLLEGRRLIVDALHAGARLKYLYFSDASLVANLPLDLLGDAELYKVQYRHLKVWADTQTPAGILGVFAKPAEGEVLCPQQDSVPLTLICDNIRDPGNMGTIIRTAAAVGCKKIIASKGCVDIWDPKVLRGGMGGHFYTCILNNLQWDEITSLVPSSSYVCIADARKGRVVEKSFDVSHQKVQQLLESEATDLLSSSDDEADDQKKLSADDSEDTSSSDDESEIDDEEKWNKAETEQYKRVPLSLVAYDDLDCTHAKDVTVIVGGETEGVSPSAKKFAFNRYGQFVTIPMVEAMNSLNSATAASLVLYEVRKQLISQTGIRDNQTKRNDAQF